MYRKSIPLPEKEIENAMNVQDIIGLEGTK